MFLFACACSVESFDTLSEVWNAQPAMARRRWESGAAVIRGRIYVVGGLVVDDICVTTSFVERFDGAWTTVSPMTRSRCQCPTAVIAEKLYVCGGEDGNGPDTVERFDPAQDTWELLRPTLHHHVDATVAFLRDRLYLFGGRGDDNVALDTVESYDPDTDSWEESTSMLNARSGAKVARVSGALYVFGGSAQGTPSLLSSVERFDPVTGRWEALPDMTATGDRLVAAIHP